MDINKTVESLTLEEKIALVSGRDFMCTNGVPRVGVDALVTADGPHGLRKQNDTRDNGVTSSEPATAFPTAACTANGWNTENAYKIGEAIAEECRYYGVDILLGPGVNIKRNPLCGRNFEYFSEDPYLAGKMAAEMIKGVQSRGVGASLKHFALNNSENYRFMGDSIADMRAIREIYLKPFEIAVKEGEPATLMCAYNKINGTYCSENAWLLDEVLREEWGFSGAVMTDWGAMRNRTLALKAGLDLEMPGDSEICRKQLRDAVRDGNLNEAALDRAVERIVTLAKRAKQSKRAAEKEGVDVDFDSHHALAAKIAEDCAVLLKNDGVLPLNGSERLCVLGDMFVKMRYQGAGSSMINATRVTSPRDAFDARGVSYVWARGYDGSSFEIDEAMINEAVAAARGCDKILIFAGLTDYAESEGFDRENMRLPENQLALIKAMTRQDLPVTVVLFGGSAVELPFAENVNAILNMYLPGQNGGTATARLLFGEANPSGRLAESWPISYVDVPFGDAFGKCQNEVYKESVFVGYRYYNSFGKKVRYPFGFGLSYTEFEYRNISVRKHSDTVSVEFEICNTGDRYGAEVAQLYVAPPRLDALTSAQELRAFKKVYLAAGEAKKVNLSFHIGDLSRFDTKKKRFVVADGEYEIRICSDSETVRLSEKIHIDGDITDTQLSVAVATAYGSDGLTDVTDEIFEEMSGEKIPKLSPKLPITMESRFSDLRATFIGKIIFSAVLSMSAKQKKEAEKMPEGEERDNKLKGALFLRRVLESGTLASMSMSSGGRFPYNVAEGLMHLANGRIFKGVATILKKIDAPPLPVDNGT